MLKTPYLLFLGDAPDQLAAKVAQGIKDWRPEFSLGQLRLPGCKADLGIADMTIAEAKAAGAQTLVVGAANRGGVISDAWIATLIEAIEAGMDIASGLHNLLRDRQASREHGESKGLSFGSRNFHRTFLASLRPKLQRSALRDEKPADPRCCRPLARAQHRPTHPRLR